MTTVPLAVAEQIKLLFNFENLIFRIESNRKNITKVVGKWASESSMWFGCDVHATFETNIRQSQFDDSILFDFDFDLYFDLNVVVFRLLKLREERMFCCLQK